MPASCCAHGCSNSVAQGKRLFRIPLGERDSARREVWLAVIKRQGFVPTSGSRLCEDHFTPDQFEQNRADGRKLLKHNAVPSIPGPTRAAGRKKERRRTRRTSNHSKKSQFWSDTMEEEEDEEEVEDLVHPHEAAGDSADGETCSEEEPDWADALTRKAMQIRLATGQRGYAIMRQMCPGFPSELQLRQCAEALPFGPGLLYGLLPVLQCKVSTMGPDERHAAIWLERVAVQPGSGSTLDTAGKEPSGHALVFTVAGLTSRWKHTLGYHLLPESISASSVGGSEVADLIKDIAFHAVRKCEALGLVVHALVTDLSTSSLSVWKRCGVSTRPVRRPVFSTLHPCATEQEVNNRRLVILADIPHIMNSIVDTLIENEMVLLPQDVVEKHGLPTEKVNFDYIRSLLAKDSAENLGFVSGISVDCFRSARTQRDMSVAEAVLSRGTVTGLRCLRTVNLLPAEAEATAWYVEQLVHWRSLMTSPTMGATSEQYKKAVEFMHEFKDTMSRISLPSHMQVEGQLCTAKIGLCVSTLAKVQLHDTLEAEGNFKNCMFLSRHSSALLENVLRTIGSVNCVPSLSDFQASLHTVALAQLFLPVQSGSLSVYGSADVAEFISSKPSEDTEDNSAFVVSEKSVKNTAS